MARAREAFVCWNEALRPRGRDPDAMSGWTSVKMRSVACSLATRERTPLAAAGWDKGVKHFNLSALEEGRAFMMPALCHAISSMVLPRTPTWSIPRLVMAVMAGDGMMLVLS